MLNRLTHSFNKTFGFRMLSTIQGEKILNKSNVSSDILDNLKDKTVTTLGYGPQAMSQSLNLKDNGVNVIIGVRKG